LVPFEYGKIAGVGVMTTIKGSEARDRLGRLVDETAASHEPILITGKRTNAVLISEEDWRAIQETLYLLSIPGMRESIREGLATPVEECSDRIIEGMTNDV
jgi:antitoxin YefM